MRVLVACEESQAVTKAFRARGHEAYSCDLQACSGGHPEWHIMHDAVEVAYSGCWDLMIAHPPCTYLATAGMPNKSKDPGREIKTAAAMAFVKMLWNAPIEKIAIENSKGVLSTRWMKPTQIVEPYYFGDPDKKMTCLWLKGLKRLNGKLEVAANIEMFKPQPVHVYPSGRKAYWSQIVGDKFRYSLDRGKMKSKTFPGIARAMAEQWG